MITVKSLQLYNDLSFPDYLAMPGVSYSYVKNGGIKIAPTEKMRFGSLVDCYLFEPKYYSGEKFSLVRPVAKAAHEVLGPLLHSGQRQLAFTCEFHYNGYMMLFKGRVDLFAGGMVIDMKISSLDLLKAINHFGYHHQMNGYCIALSAAMAIIISVHPDSHFVSKMPVPVDHKFWEAQVLKYGVIL